MTFDPSRPADIQVIAPNFKRRLSGVTSTIVRLLPLQTKSIGIVTTGPGLPDYLPRIPVWRVLLPNRQLRVWHARRNTEMLFGWVLRTLFRKRLKLLFTSASQRQHTGYTKWLIGRMDRVVATTRKSAGYLDCPADVILHGIDTESFSPSEDKPALRKFLGLPGAGLLIGCYGRIRHQKGTDVFVDAMIRALRDHAGASALVMGRATSAHQSFAKGLQGKIDAAGLSERIRILPEVEAHEMADWYRVLDLYVAPQRWEGFGLTPLEAMACAVPVIATDVGAFSELIEDGITGKIIAPDDVTALVDATLRYLEDTELMQKHGKAARNHVVAKFQLQHEADALLGVYRDLLTDRP